MWGERWGSRATGGNEDEGLRISSGKVGNCIEMGIDRGLRTVTTSTTEARKKHARMLASWSPVSGRSWQERIRTGGWRGKRGCRQRWSRERGMALKSRRPGKNCRAPRDLSSLQKRKKKMPPLARFFGSAAGSEKSLERGRKRRTGQILLG